MRCGKIPRRSVPMLATIVATGIFLTARAALAADDGDEKCSRQGSIWVYDDASKSWENVGGQCVPRGANGPANGDRKCGTSGFTIKYVASLDVWRNTQSRCEGGGMAGLHLENRHMGTEPTIAGGSVAQQHQQ